MLNQLKKTLKSLKAKAVDKNNRCSVSLVLGGVIGLLIPSLLKLAALGAIVYGAWKLFSKK